MKMNTNLILLFACLLPSLTFAETPGAPNPANKQGGLIGSNYKLHPLDVIQVTVFQEPDLTAEARLSQDGKITLALIGEVHVGGKTVGEARDLIRKLYYEGDILQNPQVTVNLLSYAERRVYVHGQVNKPGPVVIPPEETMTLSQAISAAGGVTRIADYDIVLTRVDAKGKKVVTEHELDDILDDTDTSDVVIHDSDTIFVRESPI